eukprot:SAG31_NODE_33_length_32018_cov_69.763088_2_plen_46_part_00
MLCQKVDEVGINEFLACYACNHYSWRNMFIRWRVVQLEFVAACRK